MDQDFHYYGTYYAACVGGRFTVDEATLIAKSANFIDFLSETSYSGYWKLVRAVKGAKSPSDHLVVGELSSPRYTFQGGLTSTLVSPEDGLWCSYHFTPGNFPDPDGTPTSAEVHGAEVARALPTTGPSARFPHEIRAVKPSIAGAQRTLLNRPQSPLSRALFADTLRCMKDSKRIERILKRAAASCELLPDDDGERARRIARFSLILLGVRAHVIADTWAHQDFSGISHEMNTYYDVNGASLGRQSIDYQDVGGSWKNVVLSALNHDNLKAVPSNTSYLGHGWMGHFPDYSFVKFRYRPCWRDAGADPIVRNNPEQYRHAFLELCSLFAGAKNSAFSPAKETKNLTAAGQAIDFPCEIADEKNCPRRESALAWVRIMRDAGLAPPADRDRREAGARPLGGATRQAPPVDGHGHPLRHLHHRRVERSLHVPGRRGLPLPLRATLAAQARDPDVQRDLVEADRRPRGHHHRPLRLTGLAAGVTGAASLQPREERFALLAAPGRGDRLARLGGLD